MVTQQRDTDLAQVVAAVGSPGSLASRLHSRQSDEDQKDYDRDNYHGL
jgi:hypothetical protein